VAARRPAPADSGARQGGETPTRTGQPAGTGQGGGAGGAASDLPIPDSRAVHGTIDPATGRRTEEPAVGQRLTEPVRSEIQAGRLRPADEQYQPEAGDLPTGYRVQVVATPDFAVAGAEAARVKELLGGRYPVYVEFIDPYYKVRVGDFAGQEAAQPALAEVRGLGYADAWAVRTTIKQPGP
jgi:hypothetical protein